MGKLENTYGQWKYRVEKDKKCQSYLKSYDGKFYKLIVLKSDMDYGLRKKSDKNSVNADKLECNLIRAKSRVFELGVCNMWDYFVTLTLDSKKYDRYNLKAYIKDLSRFIRNQRRKGFELSYMLIPEQHLDGAWHLHGFMKGIPENDIVPNGNYDKNGQPYMHWLPYFKKFGYMSIAPVEDDVKASFYMRKYISKTMLENNFELGVHSYYASQGLKSADDLKHIEFVDMVDYAKLDLKYESSFVDVYNLSPDEVYSFLSNLKCNT